MKKATFLVSLFLILQRTVLCLLKTGNILLVDHLNINHEINRHDLVKAFYFDTLGMTADPRKHENLDRGRKTLWANSGINQFHLPEDERAQVFDGVITLSCIDGECLADIERKLSNPPSILKDGTRFSWRKSAEEQELHVTDPWGSMFKLIVNPDAFDARGVQPEGDKSILCAMSDLCVHVPKDASIPGIARFYDQVFGAPCLDCNENEVKIITSPQQTLTFRRVAEDVNVEQSELKQDDEGMANYGPHISMYVTNFSDIYEKAEKVGSLFVNHRFKRRAYTLDEAKKQCMFRTLDVVDPENISAGSIIKLEHEVRSVITIEGKKYKSCPFHEVI